MGKNIWVSPKNGEWIVKQEGDKNSIANFSKKSDAENFGRNLAKANQSELISQKRNGQIGSKDSFGNDPCPPKDREH